MSCNESNVRCGKWLLCEAARQKRRTKTKRRAVYKTNASRSPEGARGGAQSPVPAGPAARPTVLAVLITIQRTAAATVLQAVRCPGGAAAILRPFGLQLLTGMHGASQKKKKRKRERKKRKEKLKEGKKETEAPARSVLGWCVPPEFNCGRPWWACGVKLPLQLQADR